MIKPRIEINIWNCKIIRKQNSSKLSHNLSPKKKKLWLKAWQNVKLCSVVPVEVEEEAEAASGCRDAVCPAGGRGVMQGVGGDSSVSHCTHRVSPQQAGRWRKKERDGGEERESGQRDKKVRDRPQAVRVFSSSIFARTWEWEVFWPVWELKLCYRFKIQFKLQIKHSYNLILIWWCNTWRT